MSLKLSPKIDCPRCHTRMLCCVTDDGRRGPWWCPNCGVLNDGEVNVPKLALADERYGCSDERFQTQA
jgi:transcription elongation factor Elf1